MNPEANANKVIIEQHKRFSECILWEMQRNYFDSQGINAWVNQVPFYITSNPFIGTSYAKVVIRFIRDWIAKNPKAKDSPFYIIELGTGSGRFSYYAIKALDELRKDFGMEDVEIVYVMSDFTKHNIEYHQTHAALKPYFDKGMVDSAIYNMENDDHIHLVNKNIDLGPKTLVNPLTIFANYIFDTVSHDSFSVHNGKLYELLVTLSTDRENMNGNLPVDWEKITIDHHVNEIHGSYYGEPELDKVLDLYKNSLRDTSFLVPIASIRAIKRMLKLANNKLFMIASDKAYSEMHSLENLGYPSIAFHGSFSMMVNFHAVGEYIKNLGGDYFAQPSRRGIKTCVFSSGFLFNDLPETHMAVKEYVEGFSPSDYFNLHRHMSEVSQTADLDAIASHLELSCWDPNIYARVSSRITSILNESDSDTVNFLERNMHKLAANYYYMPKSECLLFEVGVFYHALKKYPEALGYYREAEKFVGEQFGLFYNMGLCLHHINKNDEALRNFKKAVALDSESKEAHEWVAHLEKMMLEKKFQPKDIYRS